MMTSFFAYLAISCGMLTIIFTVITCIMSTQRYFLVLATLALLAGTLVSSFVGYVSFGLLQTAGQYYYNRYTSNGMNVFSMLIVYIIVRVSIFFSDKVTKVRSRNKSFLLYACFIIQFLFPGAILLLLSIHLVVYIALFLITLVLFIWFLHSFNDKSSADLMEKFLTNNTLVSNTTINVTKIT
jgi:hypothetical protein